jgi:hypothetical protein
LLREEAVALLKEMLALNLVTPSFVELYENKHGKFDIKLSLDCDVASLKQFLAERSLTMKKDSEKGYCFISKP